MTEIYYRCPSCMGSKKGMRLGCVEGDCNLCKGEGKINEKDRPKPVIVEPVIPVLEVVNAVNEVHAPSVTEEIAIDTTGDILSQVVDAKSKPVYGDKARKVFKRVKGVTI